MLFDASGTEKCVKLVRHFIVRTNEYGMMTASSEEITCSFEGGDVVQVMSSAHGLNVDVTVKDCDQKVLRSGH